MNQKNKKILLITTKGCEACKILNSLIQKAISEYDSNIEYSIKDKDEIDIKFLKEHHINDFPTTIFYQDNIIVFIFIGTKPIAMIKKYMLLHFD